MKAARAAFIIDLEVVAKQAIKDDMLDEAVRIKETIKDLKSQQIDDKGTRLFDCGGVLRVRRGRSTGRENRERSVSATLLSMQRLY